MIEEDRLCLPLCETIGKSFILCFGITEIKGYEPTKFYINDGKAYSSVTFSKKTTKSCNIIITEDPNVSTGAPIEVKIKSNSIDITDWIASYSKDILIQAYSMFDEDIEKTTETVHTQWMEIKALPKGLQITGSIKSGKSSDVTEYSVKYICNFYLQPEQPMIGRAGDPRIGYFYDNIKIETQSKLTGNPHVIINRMNTQKPPWKYIIDANSIPKEYHEEIKSGVLSWNKYFEKLEICNGPIEVIIGNDETDPFDMNAWYITGTSAKNFNGPYSGYSISISDNRSGENLFGIISLNLIKIVSNPTRYIVMNNFEEKMFGHHIKQYISWISSHEMGHQLGLRHNFMGNFKKDNVSTVMDYVDIFNDLSNLNTFNPWGTLREYDLIAIKYGYMRLKGEKTGIKHKLLTTLLDDAEYSFGTDENYSEDINPMVNTTENVDDPLEFVKNIIPMYQKYRSNLIGAIKSKEITSYEYNNLFSYIYTQKYVDIADICLKYVGGRYYGKQRQFFVPIKKVSIVKAVEILMLLLTEFEYTNDEYQYFMYDYAEDNSDRQLFNRIQLESIYSTNVINLYYFYQTLVNHIMKGITSTDKIIRLSQGNEFTYTDLLYNFTFCYKNSDTYDIQEADGIFPEIGMLLDNASDWQKVLLDISPLKYNRQYSWMERLRLIAKNSDNYINKKGASEIIETISDAINNKIMPYLKSIEHKENTGSFWKQPYRTAYNHWKLLEGGRSPP